MSDQNTSYSEAQRRAAIDRVIARVQQEAQRIGRMPKKKFVRRVVRKEPALHDPEAVRMLIDEHEVEGSMRARALRLLFD